MKKITLFAILSMLTSVSHAGGAESFNVDFVGCFPDGKCFIGINPNATATTCTNKSQVRFQNSNAGAREQYAAAMTAFALNKKIRVHLKDICLDDFPTPDFIHVNNE